MEDDADLAQVTQAVLEHEGLQVAVAHDGREALELIDTPRLQVAITDLVMCSTVWS